MTPEFQSDGVFDVYKMLDAIRRRPGMYIGEPSLTKLWLYLHGYSSALSDDDIPQRKVDFHDGIKFDAWIRKHLSLPYNSEGWANNILNSCDRDEAKALAKFFELLDEFRRQEQEDASR